MLRVVWGVILLSIVATGAVTASGGPLADAGLDQTVDQHSRVYLDAGGSVAPDGEIESYEWVIERPDGSTMNPDCATCAQTSFVADTAGEYAVTVTVTDDSGATAEDTLYVTVRDVDPPTATVRGPTAVEKGESVTYELDGEAGTRDLAAYELAVGGDRVTRRIVDDGSPREMTVTFSETGEQSVTGSVVDEYGVAGEDTLAVEVTESGCTGCVDIEFGGGGGSGGDGGGNPFGADATVYEGADGETTVEIDSTITDLNPEGTTTFMMDGNQYEVDNERYRDLAYKSGEDGVSKEQDVKADEVLVDPSKSDQLKQDARDEGNVETFGSSGGDGGSDSSVLGSVASGAADHAAESLGFDDGSSGAAETASGLIDDAADAVDNLFGGSDPFGGAAGGNIDSGGHYTGSV